MAKTGSMTELERRLQAKAEEDRERAEQIYLAELKTLGANLRRCASKERSSTERAMEALTRPVRGTLRRLTGLYIALGVLLSLGTWGANLALVQRRSSQIESLREERARLETKIADQRLTLERLNEKTWGVDLAENNDGKFVLLPRDTRPGTPFQFEGRWVLPLSTE